MLAFIDARGEPPGGGGRREDPWFITALRWAFPWPALVVWLFVAGQLLDGWAGVAALWASIIVATWRLLRTIPVGPGMRDYRQ
jgi:hypothetical protein